LLIDPLINDHQVISIYTDEKSKICGGIKRRKNII